MHVYLLETVAGFGYILLLLHST